MGFLYFDQAASAFPKAPGTAEAVACMLMENAVNIGRGNYELSYALAETVMDIREHILHIFHANPDASVCFTSGATQALNQFLFGLLKNGDHVVTTSIEHNAVMRPLAALEKRGVAVSVVSCEDDGSLNPEKIRSAIRPDTKAVIATHASNVCGTVLPIDEIGRICKERDVYFAVDAAQTAGSYPINMKKMQIDFLSFPGHKGLRGPQGVGGFVIRKQLADALTPLIYGGTGSVSNSEIQPDFLPDKFESGTLPLPAIIGLGAAIHTLDDDAILSIRERELSLTRRFLSGVLAIPGIVPVGITDPESPKERVGVVSLYFKQADNALKAFELERDYGILTRVGLHCAPRAHKTLGTFPQGTIRFSFGPENTEDEVDQALAALKHIS